MTRPTISADFNDADPAGRLRLICVGTTLDLSEQGVRLRDGLALTLIDEELEADGVVEYSANEHRWVARIDWDAVRSHGLG